MRTFRCFSLSAGALFISLTLVVTAVTGSPYASAQRVMFVTEALCAPRAERIQCAQSLLFYNLTAEAWESLPVQGTLSDAALSPHGDQVALVLQPVGESQSDLFLLDVVTQRFERMTESRAYEGALRWAADGSALAFLVDDQQAQRRFAFHALQFDAYGCARPWLQTPPSSSDFSPATWLPDGNGPHVITAHEGRIYGAEANTSQLVPMTPDEDLALPLASPSEAGVFAAVEARTNRLAIVSINDFEDVAVDFAIVDGVEITAYQPIAWSPDGRKLYVTGPTVSQAYTDRLNVALIEIDFDRRDRTTVLDGRLGALQFSPDVSLLAYTVSEGDGQSQACIQSLQGETTVCYPEHVNINITPTWGGSA